MADFDWESLASLLGPAINAVSAGAANSNSNRASEEDKARYKAILAKLGALESPDFDTANLDAEAGRMDPALVAKQMQAMAGLKEIQDSGGLTLADQAAQNKALNQVARQESAGRNAIQARQDARGTGSSGASLAMQLSNNQSAANRANETGMNTAASAQKRYLQSILQQGQLAGQMSDRDMRAKQARDVMAQYNQKNRNVYGQQGFQNNYTKITGQMPGTDRTVWLNQGQAGRNSEYISDMGAMASTGVTDILRDRPKTKTAPYSTPPLVGSDEDEWQDPYSYPSGKIDDESDR